VGNATERERVFGKFSVHPHVRGECD